MTAKRKTFDIDHTGKGGPVRMPLERYTNLSDEYPSDRISDIVKEAADIIARREYGKGGYCRICNLNSWTQDGTLATYECFIGYSVGDGNTSGRNIQIYWRKPEEPKS